MAIGRFYRNTPFKADLYAPNISFLAESLQYLQKAYDRNFAEAEQLKGIALQALPQDRLRADAITADINRQVDAIVEKYQGDYSQATKDLYRLKAKLQQENLPGREMYTIQNNYKTYVETDKKHKDLLQQGKITADQYTAWKSYIDRTYKGAVKDPVTSTYANLDAPALVPFVDGVKKADEEVSKLKPRKTTLELPPQRDPKTGIITYQKQTVEAIDPKEAAQTFRNTLINDPGYISYISQLAHLKGVKPEDLLNQTITSYIQNELPAKTGIFNYAEDSSRMVDPVYMANLKFKHALALDQAKRDRDKAEEQEDQHRLAIFGYANTNFGYRNPVDPKQYPMPIHKIISQGQGKFNNLNVHLLQTIREANPTLPDAAIWKLYNDNVSGVSFGTELVMTPLRTSTGQDERTKVALRNMAAGNVPIYEYNVKTGQIRQLESSSERMDVYKSSFHTEKSSNNPDYNKPVARVVGISSSANGQLPVGDVLSVPGKDKVYIVSATDAGLFNYNFGFDGRGGGSIRNAAFGFIQNPNVTVGEPFTLTTNTGQNLTLAGVKEYEWDPGSKRAIARVRYYSASRGKNGSVLVDKKDPLTVNGVPLDNLDLEKMLISSDAFKTLLPYQKAKPQDSASTMENFYNQQ